MRSIDKLEPYGPTPAEEMCACEGAGPVLLVSKLGPFPVHCAACGGEIPLQAFSIPDELAEDLAQWVSVHDSLYHLWLDSGEYEEWARERLLDPGGWVNTNGVALAGELSRERPTYFVFFKDTDVEDAPPVRVCPFCEGPLETVEDVSLRACHACHVAVY